jgi:hypothetical protein
MEESVDRQRLPQAEPSGTPLTPEDVQALEGMAKRGDIDFNDFDK